MDISCNWIDGRSQQHPESVACARRGRCPHSDRMDRNPLRESRCNHQPSRAVGHGGRSRRCGCPPRSDHHQRESPVLSLSELSARPSIDDAVRGQQRSSSGLLSRAWLRDPQSGRNRKINKFVARQNRSGQRLRRVCGRASDECIENYSRPSLFDTRRIPCRARPRAYLEAALHPRRSRSALPHPRDLVRLQLKICDRFRLRRSNRRGTRMNHDLENTVALLDRTPAALDDLLRGLPETWTHRNEGEGTFTVFDVIGHLIHADKFDWMPRARMILDHGETRPFEPFDRWGHVDECKGRTLPQLLEEFVRVRAGCLEALRALNLTQSQLELRGRHPALGPVTLSELLY